MKDRSKFLAIAFLATAASLFAPAVFAHTFGAHGAAFAEGFTHPFLGLDHVLAMLAVGVWAAQLGSSALWRIPSAFVAAMAVGALAANPFMDTALLEAAIAGSVLVFGLLIVFFLRLPGWSALSVVGLFALFHGFAHGLEIPQAASPVEYGLGFLSATVCLHLLGVLFGLSLRHKQFALRVGGLACAFGGLWLLAV